MLLSVVGFGSLLSIMDFGIIAIGFPALIVDFQTDANVIVWLALAYYLGSTAPLLTLGWVSDTIGRTKVYVWGVIVVIVSLALASLAQDVNQLIAARVLTAFGHSMVLANDNALITQDFPPHERGIAQGINNMALGVGIGGGYYLGGLLIDYLDWRALFWARIPAHVLWVFVAWRYLRNDPLPVVPAKAGTTPGAGPVGQRGPIRIDFAGAIVLTAAMITGLLAINQADELGFFSTLEFSLLMLTAGFLAVLVVIERLASAPIIEIKLFASKVFSSGVVAQIFIQIAHGGWNFLSPFFLIQGLGFSATLAGLAILPFHLARLVFSPVGGIMADKLGTLWPSLLGLVLLAGGLLVLGYLGFTASIWLIVLAITVSGAGLSIAVPANNIAIMGYVPREYLSSAAGFLATSRVIGTAIGTALGAAVYTRSLGWPILTAPGGASPSVVAAFGDAIIIVSLASFVGLLTILWRGRA